MKLFAQIRKVDEQHRMVYGRAVQEIPDRVGEIFDYEKSKPYFKAWSEGFSDATDGKSKGNIRAMHGKVSAGIAKQIDFVDADKAIDIGAHINDDQEWAKVLAGNYTGFSIGGSYVGDPITEKMDGKDVRRYVANPSEISIVDSPCIPSAKFFQVIKADGVTAEVAFEKAPIEVRGSDDDVARFGESLNAAGLTLAKAIEMVDVAAMLDTADDIEKREFSADERKAAAKEGAALPDGSFPIKTKGDLSNAVAAYGRAKNKAAAKAHIIKRAKALDALDMLPAAWKEKVDAAGEVQKGMWNVSRFAECLECVASIAMSAQSDFDYEGDNSPVPALLRNWLGEGVDIFKGMADEESSEMVGQLKEHANIGADDEIEMAIAMAIKAGALAKAMATAEAAGGTTLDDLFSAQLTTSEIIKAVTGQTEIVPALKAAVIAKAMTTAQKDKLQAAHDHLTSLGAACGGEKAAPAPVVKVDATPPPSDVATLQKLVSDQAARLAKLESQPVPHVMLRTVAVAKGGAASDAPTDALQAAIVEKGYGWAVKNPDGTIDYASTKQKMENELGAAA
jgi:hypothetical protein